MIMIRIVLVEVVVVVILLLVLLTEKHLNMVLELILRVLCYG